MVPGYDDATNEQRDDVFRRYREQNEAYEQQLRARTTEEWKAALELEREQNHKLRRANETQFKWLAFLCMAVGLVLLHRIFPHFVDEWLRCSGVNYFTCGR